MGRLNVIAPSATLNVSGFAFVSTGSPLPLTAPTTATLAISRFAASNPAGNISLANTDFDLLLFQITPPAGQPCDDPVSAAVLVARDALRPGTNVQDTYATPLLFKPTGTQPYCIGVLVIPDGASPSTYDNPYVQLTGYVAAGTYNPASSFATTAAAQRSSKAPRVTPQNPHPAGTLR